MPSLQFKGKPLVQNHHLVVPFAELEAVKSRGLSKTPSLHDNLIIEGDNLKALKALLPMYHGKVKCIYIDPPYNTGNEGWIYNDKVNSPMMRDWLGRTVDRDDLTRHDKWCCMMLPRLKLLRELLRHDGAIFISADDNEIHRLRSLMEEVFGEAAFVATIVWQKRYSRDNRPPINTVHDYIVVYCPGGEEQFKDNRNKISPEEGSLAVYRNPNDDPRGRWRPIPMSAQGYRKNQMYEIVTPTGITHRPPPGRCWSMVETEFKKLLCEGSSIGVSKRGMIWFGKDGNSQPNVIRYLDEVEGFVPWTWFTHEYAGHTDEAKKEFYEIMGTEAGFGTPKPSKLIRRILEIYTKPDGGDIVLDSFAGSGTTAQAVLALNKEDGGNRQFVLCQMPYETKEQEAGKQNICDSITSERVRRAIRGVPDSSDENLRKGLGGTFSYFKLGKELKKQAILDGKDLPSFEALAGYVFFTATGEEFQPKKMKPPFIGTSRDRDVFLIYKQDIQALKDMALNLELAREIAKRSDRKALVFAPTKYLDQEYLDQLRIEFCQLPFEIYQRAQTQ